MIQFVITKGDGSNQGSIWRLMQSPWLEIRSHRDQGAGFGIGDNESRPDVYWTWRAEEAVDANGLDIEEKNGDWLAFLGLQMESYGTERLGVGRVWGRVCHARKAPEWRHPVFTSWSVTCGMHDTMNNGGSRFSVNRAN